VNSRRAIRELTLTRVRVMIREPEVIFWVFAFPLLLAVGLGVAFRDPPAEPAAIAVEIGSAAERHFAGLERSEDVAPRLLPPAAARDALRRGEVVLVVGGDAGESGEFPAGADPGAGEVVLRYDPTRPEGRTARIVVDAALQRAAGADRPVSTRTDEVRQRGARYIDWLIPGLIGFNLLSTSLWAIGFYVVQMRSNRQLKRLVATPMRRRDFLLSQMLARLAFVVIEVPLLLVFAWVAFGVRIEGSFLQLAALVLVGTVSFSGLGLLAAARPRTVEGVSGIINVILMPMVVLSGVFFSASRFPDAVQPFIRALPLTALNDGLRAIMNDGLPLTAVPLSLAVLAGWAVVSYAAALYWFRWQ
jgi:ABC-2 type transport system permease protein